MTLKLDDPTTTRWNWLKWIIAILLIIAGVIANYHYNYQPWSYRAIGGLIVFAAVVGILSQTNEGKRAWIFARESRMELRKVVWPTRQDIMQTTLVIALMVTVLALLLWGMDGILVWLIGWLTGQRG